MSATTTRTAPAQQEKPTKFVEHVKKYPTVQSGVSTFQSYPLGQKTIDTLAAYYTNLLGPFLQNFAGPYGYVKPYVIKADNLADTGLGKVDSTFPIITEKPETIKATVLDFAYTPFRLVNDGRTYVHSTYGQEYKKCGGDDAGPLISGSKAAFTTSIVVGANTLNWLSEFVSARKVQGQELASAKYKQGQDFASAKYAQGSQYATQSYEFANGKKDEALAYASDTAEKARNLAYAKAEDAKNTTEKVKKDAKAKTAK